jgi:hypothetical protein
VAAQVSALTAVSEGWLEGLEPPQAAALVWRAVERARSAAPEVVRGLNGEGPLPEDWQARLRACVEAERPAPVRGA